MATRSYSVDLIKGISILAVILVHTHPFGLYDGSSRSDLEIVINQLCRFAVPLFFILSGYFFAQKMRTENDFSFIKKRIKSLITLFVMWSIFYLLISFDVVNLMAYGYVKVLYWKVYDLMTHPIDWLFTGSATHLWFLPALASSLALVVFLQKFGERACLTGVGILYVIGVLGGAYGSTLFGVALPFESRNGPMMGGLFVAIGFWLANHNLKQITKELGFGLIVLGAIGQLLEAFSIGALSSSAQDLTTIDYVFSTVMFGLGVAILALKLEVKKSSFFVEAGALSLGIYLTHMWFVDLFSLVREFDVIAINSWVVPSAVLFMSYYFTKSLIKGALPIGLKGH